MTLQDWAYIATIAGVISIPISAFFIWLQLRQQTRLAKIRNTQSLVQLSSLFNHNKYQQKQDLKLIPSDGTYQNKPPQYIDKNITDKELYYWNFENKWKPSINLNVNGNNSWQLIAKSDGYFYICQTSDTNKCLHNEHGSLQLSDIESDWYSAMWYFEDAGNGYIRIRNKWKQSEYIHIEYGSPAVGTIELDWWSAQWKRFNF